MGRRPRHAQALALGLGGLLALAGVATAQDGTTLRVATDGSADYATIKVALEAAAPGDTILIAPGEYVGNLYIDKPVTLRGDGPRDAVMVVPDPTDPLLFRVETGERITVAIQVDDADATIEHLSIAETEGIVAGIVLDGASPSVRDVVSPMTVGANGDSAALIEDSDLDRVILSGPGVDATVRRNTVSDAIIVDDGASGSFEGNLILDHPLHIFDGGSAEIIGNTFRPAEGELAILLEWSGDSMIARDNVIEGGWQAIVVEHAESAHVEGNTITDAAFGIVITESGGIVRDNAVSGASEVGILVSGNGTLAEANSITGGRVGMIASTPSGYPPGAPRFDAPSRILGNTIADATYFGLVINDASPVVSGNTICAQREPISFEGNAEPQLGSNEICELSAADG